MPLEWVQAAVGIETVQIGEAAEFAELLRRSNSVWWEGDVSPWIFRGHSVSGWTLLPSAWRPNNPIINACRSEVTRRMASANPTHELRWAWGNHYSWETTFTEQDAVLKRQLAIAASAELFPVFEFCLGCAELGIPTPLDGAGFDPSSSENWLYNPTHPLVADSFTRFTNVTEGVALAQHHGIPTRFLDWTRNPLAAAFFAVDDSLQHQRNEDIAVWALHSRLASNIKVFGKDFPDGSTPRRVELRISLVRPAVRDNVYLTAQAGLFTEVFGAGIFFMANGGARPPLERIIEASDSAAPLLRKMILPRTKVRELANILRKEGVIRSALMPSKDNVAADVMRRWLL